MLRGFFKRLWSGPSWDLKPYQDPVLGMLQPEADAGQPTWKAGPFSGISITIQGEETPDSQALQRARDIHARLETYKAEAEAFLRAQAQTNEWAAFRDQIGRLKLEEIALWRLNQKRCDGMLFFEEDGESDDVYVWRCDLIDGRPANLGYDH